MEGIKSKTDAQPHIAPEFRNGEDVINTDELSFWIILEGGDDE